MRKLIPILCGLALVAPGCGGAGGGPTKEQAQEGNLRGVGELCRHYQTAKQKPPAKLTDLASLSSVEANAYSELASGKIVLLYGASLPNLNEEPGEGPDDEVLAYAAEVPQDGGKVLMLNRTVKTMTADEFKAAKKAGKEVPPPSTTTKG